jgi:hypothetical protein
MQFLPGVREFFPALASEHFAAFKKWSADKDSHAVFGMTEETTWLSRNAALEIQRGIRG